jgi:hypothetical protein
VGENPGGANVTGSPASTDSNGYYEFMNLARGNYRLIFNEPSGSTMTTDSSRPYYDLSVITDHDFGYYFESGSGDGNGGGTGLPENPSWPGVCATDAQIANFLGNNPNDQHRLPIVFPCS